MPLLAIMNIYLIINIIRIILTCEIDLLAEMQTIFLYCKVLALSI